MRTITLAFSLSALPLLADIGPERVIAPPAAVRALARSDEAVAVVLSGSAGTRALLTDFDGAPLRTIALSDAAATDAAAASDGRSILFTWIEGGALHAALLRGEALEAIAIDDAPSDAPLFALFDGTRYVVLTAHQGLTISPAGVIEERFPFVPVAAAAAANGRIVASWVDDDRKLIQLKVAELLPDHELGEPRIVASQVVAVGGQWWIDSAALTFEGAGGYVAWSRLAGRCCDHVEGSRVASDLAPLDSVRSPLSLLPQIDAPRVSTFDFLGSVFDQIRVAPLGNAFLVAWRLNCGCGEDDGVWAAEVDSAGFARPQFMIRRGASTPALAALPGNRVAIVYAVPAGVVMRVFAPPAPRARPVRR